MKQRYIDVVERRLGEGPYAATGPQTLAEIGRALGVTRQRAYQIERSAWKGLLNHYAGTQTEELKEQQEGDRPQSQEPSKQERPNAELASQKARTNRKTRRIGSTKT